MAAERKSGEVYGLPEPHVVSDGLAVYSIGEGDPVLLMPGPHRYQLPGDGSASPLIGGLARRLGRRVVSFDPPGSGRSWDRPALLGMREMLDCAEEALESCGIRGAPVDVFGHSMAGLCALAFALDRPSRVRRLVLAGTGSGGPAYMGAPGALWNRTHPAFWTMALLGTLSLLWRCQAISLIMLNFIEHHSYVDKGYVHRRNIELKDWCRRREGHPEWHRIAVKIDYSKRLGEIKAPTLLLCGRDDPQFPASSSEELERGIMNSKLVFFSKSGHFPFIEESDTFWSSVALFLDS